MAGRRGVDRAAIDTALDCHGLMTRGAAHEGASTIVLVGHAGSSIWPHFARWREHEPNPEAPDPLDRWSRWVLEPLAARFGARALFPSDRPYRPFQRWAMEAEGLRPSPLGVLIHPEYGLWHAYRGALVFDGRIEGEPPAPRPHPCDSCVGKPCLKACPVDAFDGSAFDPVACRGYLASARGANCLMCGCAARLACPVGQDWAYDDRQQAFHMAAFQSPPDL